MLLKRGILMGMVALTASCGPVTNDRYLGQWESNCFPTDRVVASLNVPYSVLWMKETLTISANTITSDASVYFNSSCTLPATLLNVIPLSRGGTITKIVDFTTNDNYPAVGYQLIDPNGVTSEVDLATVDNVVYSVFVDPLATVTAGEVQKNVIFDWHYTKL